MLGEAAGTWQAQLVGKQEALHKLRDALILNSLQLLANTSHSPSMLCFAVQVLEGLQAQLAGKQEALHKLGDALALLDFLQSLAHAASLSDEVYSRPSISHTGKPNRSAMEMKQEFELHQRCRAVCHRWRMLPA